MIQHPNTTYRNLLADLHEADVQYALLRDDMRTDKPIRDLDILVSRKQMAAFDSFAASHGFYLIKDGYLNPCKRVYLKMEEGTPLILDVHTEVIFRGLVFLDSKKALANRQRVGGFYRLAPEEFLISLLFHNVLAKKRIQQKHASLLFDLMMYAKNQQVLHAHLKPFGLQKIFEELTGQFEQMYKQPALVREIAKRTQKKLIRSKFANRWRVLQIAAREKKVKFFGKKRGIIVTFLGPDGAGKSTTIDAIRDRLKDIGVSNKMAYLGPWGGSILNLQTIISLLHLKPYRDDYKAFDKGRIAKKPGPLKGMQNVRFQTRSVLYYALLLFEMATRWLVLVLPLLRQGRLVLSDRYFYDILTGYKNKPIDYHVKLRQRLCSFYPKPDVGIVLDASPEVIYARKPQLTEKQLQQSRRVYAEIAREYGFYVLDTSSTVEDTLADFEERILPEILVRLDGRKKNIVAQIPEQPLRNLEPARL